jgi:homoserine dehydrogenase
MSGEIDVLKFGSSVLESWSDVPSVVHEIYGWYRTGQVLRVVARKVVERGRLLGVVCLRALDSNHPLAAIPGEWNRLIITPACGPSVTVSGRGAGRWLTTEAIIADLLDLRHLDCRVPGQVSLSLAGQSQGVD